MQSASFFSMYSGCLLKSSLVENSPPPPKKKTQVSLIVSRRPNFLHEYVADPKLFFTFPKMLVKRHISKSECVKSGFGQRSALDPARRAYKVTTTLLQATYSRMERHIIHHTDPQCLPMQET